MVQVAGRPEVVDAELDFDVATIADTRKFEIRHIIHVWWSWGNSLTLKRSYVRVRLAEKRLKKVSWQLPDITDKGEPPLGCKASFNLDCVSFAGLMAFIHQRTYRSGLSKVVSDPVWIALKRYLS